MPAKSYERCAACAFQTPPPHSACQHIQHVLKDLSERNRTRQNQVMFVYFLQFRPIFCYMCMYHSFSSSEPRTWAFFFDETSERIRADLVRNLNKLAKASSLVCKFAKIFTNTWFHSCSVWFRTQSHPHPNEANLIFAFDVLFSGTAAALVVPSVVKANKKIHIEMINECEK